MGLTDQGRVRAVHRRGALVAQDPRARAPDRIDRRGDEVFFWFAREGQWHHVYDVRVVHGRLRRVPYESRLATHRIFVVPVGQQWRYTFGENDLRSITATELARQRAPAVFHPGKNPHGEKPR